MTIAVDLGRKATNKQTNKQDVVTEHFKKTNKTWYYMWIICQLLPYSAFCQIQILEWAIVWKNVNTISMYEEKFY